MPRATRVAYVIGELNKGGAEYQLVELLRHVDRARIEPHVVVLSEGGHWADEVRRIGVPLRELPRHGSGDVRRIGTLRGALRAIRPDVLHTILWSANCYGRLAAFGLRIPRVVTAERNAIARPGWEIAIERGLDPMTDVYLVNAAAVARELERHGLPARKMRIVHNGVDLGRFPPFRPEREEAREALGLPAGRRLVAQVGRLAPQKDFPTFLAAAARVAVGQPDVDFLVVGDGPEEARLRALAATLGIAERVRWLGLRHDVPRILAGVDVAVLASRFEGLPNVVIEAMAAGAAVVAADVGGCRELIGASEGVLVDGSDPERFAAAVSALLTDDARRRAIACAARARIEREFSIERMVERTCAVYAEGV